MNGASALPCATNHERPDAEQQEDQRQQPQFFSCPHEAPQFAGESNLSHRVAAESVEMLESPRGARRPRRRASNPKLVDARERARGLRPTVRRRSPIGVSTTRYNTVKKIGDVTRDSACPSPIQARSTGRSRVGTKSCRQYRDDRDGAEHLRQPAADDATMRRAPAPRNRRRAFPRSDVPREPSSIRNDRTLPLLASRGLLAFRNRNGGRRGCRCRCA